MKQMTPAAVERAMKLQDVMLRAMAKRITWYQAAEILGISGRQMLRWQTRFKHEGYEGLFDRRRGTPSPKRVPLEYPPCGARHVRVSDFCFRLRLDRSGFRISDGRISATDDFEFLGTLVCEAHFCRRF
jgi:hypothetical protein